MKVVKKPCFQTKLADFRMCKHAQCPVFLWIGALGTHPGGVPRLGVRPQLGLRGLGPIQ